MTAGFMMKVIQACSQLGASPGQSGTARQYYVASQWPSGKSCQVIH